jgi:hypothetical protein
MREPQRIVAFASDKAALVFSITAPLPPRTKRSPSSQARSARRRLLEIDRSRAPAVPAGPGPGSAADEGPIAARTARGASFCPRDTHPPRGNNDDAHDDRRFRHPHRLAPPSAGPGRREPHRRPEREAPDAPSLGLSRARRSTSTRRRTLIRAGTSTGADLRPASASERRRRDRQRRREALTGTIGARGRGRPR